MMGKIHTEKNDKRVELYYIRAILCMLIVFVHSNLYSVHVDSSLFKNIIVPTQGLFFFATPCFIILSEVVLAYAYRDKPLNISKFILNRVKYILLPYIFVGTFVAYSHSLVENKDFISTWIEHILKGAWDGWFVVTIIQFYILHLLLHKVLPKINPFLIILPTVILTIYHTYNMQVNNDYIKFWIETYPLFPKTNILNWIGYFFVGFYIGQYYEHIIKFIKNYYYIVIIGWLFSLGFVLYTIFIVDRSPTYSTRYDLVPYTIMSFLLLLLMTYLLKNKKIILLLIISQFSYFIYLTHYIFLIPLKEVAAKFAFNGFLYIFMIWLLSLVASLGLAVFISLIPNTQFIVGKNNLLRKFD